MISDAYAEVEKGNHQKAREIFSKACENKNSDGCIRAAFIHNTSKKIPIDKVKAQELFKKACTLGNSLGCEMNK